MHTLVTTHILVVDDDPLNLLVVESYLEDLPFWLSCCANGEDAWQVLEEQPIDLVLLDLLMPGMQGDALLARMRADPRFRHLPVIMLSACDKATDIQHCLAAGATAYLVKPFTGSAVLQEILANLPN